MMNKLQRIKDWLLEQKFDENESLKFIPCVILYWMPQSMRLPQYAHKIILSNVPTNNQELYDIIDQYVKIDSAIERRSFTAILVNAITFTLDTEPNTEDIIFVRRAWTLFRIDYKL